MENDTTYELSRVFPVAPGTLFSQFLDETTLKTIWGVSQITIDARPEGQARARLTINDENWDFTITYKEVVPGQTLRWIVHFDRLPSKEIKVTLRFKEIAAGTELILRMENFESSNERDQNRQAWEAALETLQGLISPRNAT
jgi:uncharacterized protein YndB with AHSA1/START domain